MPDATATTTARTTPSSAPAPAKRPRKKPKRKLPSAAHLPIYAAVRGGVAAMHAAGVDPSARAMRALGGRFAKLPVNAKRIDRATDNLAWCFPDWSHQRAHDCAVESYRHLFALAAEVAVAPRLLAGEEYATYIQFGDLTQGLERILADGPCILVTGHCGNWEILGLTLSVLGVPIHALYRPLDMKPLDTWLRRTRSARGMHLVDKFGAAQHLPELMQRNAAVAFVADQNAGDRGLFVPYFDRLASAYKAIGVTAMRFNAPILCGHAIRLAGGAEADISLLNQHPDAGIPNSLFRYRVEIADVIRPHEWKDAPDPLFYITARYRLAIEHMVRRNPEQYLWMHRYWKSRPRHERDKKPLPDRLRAKIEELPWMTPERVERVVERSAIDAAEFTPRRKR